MIGFAEKWADIRRQLAAGGGDALWLIGHASYLMRTSGVVWMVDPVLRPEEHDIADADLAKALGEAKVALITHMHADHYDERFLRAMRNAECLWLLPAFLTEEEKRRAAACCGRVRFLEENEETEVACLRIRAFPSLHRDSYNGVTHGLDELGYRVVVGNRTYLSPGDVRSYGSAPPLGRTDDLFAHVWLGRCNALSVAQTDIDAFANYFAISQASRIWLGHLNDMTRDAADRWTEDHASRVREALQKLLPDADIRIPRHGDMQPL